MEGYFHGQILKSIISPVRIKLSTHARGSQSRLKAGSFALSLDPHVLSRIAIMKIISHKKWSENMAKVT